MIVKVQRPIFPDTDDWLIYSENKDVWITMQPTGQMKLAMGSAYKRYFHAHFNNGGLQLTTRVIGLEW